MNDQPITLTLPRRVLEFIYARSNVALRVPELSDADRIMFQDLVKLSFRALNASPALFVYVKSLRGPEPQLWPHGTQRVNQKPVIALKSHALTTIEAAMTLDQLSELYPFN